MPAIPITITGNITGDPDMRFTPAGIGVATFTVAANERVKSGDGWTDGPTSFVTCHAWRHLADHVAESLSKGDRVVVVGHLRQRGYDVEPKHPGDTGKRTVWEVTAHTVGADLTYATVKLTRVRRDAAPLPSEPWRNVPPPGDDDNSGGYSDEPPF